MLTQKTNEKLFSHPLERTNFLPKEKNSYTYLTKYAISYDYQKKQFSKQKISYTFQKNKFLILAQISYTYTYSSLLQNDLDTFHEPFLINLAQESLDIFLYEKKIT